jgi:hypothetical protein
MRISDWLIRWLSYIRFFRLSYLRITGLAL